MAEPTPYEQLTLELINQARMDPKGEFNRLIISTNPVQAVESGITSALIYFGVDLNVFRQQLQSLTSVAPLAWNRALADAADTHSQKMILQDTQSHQLPGEASLSSRVETAGYTNWNSIGENIFAYSTSALYGHAGFFIDWGGSVSGMQSPPGHRNNIMSSGFTEVGIGVIDENNPSTSVGSYVTTQDFGNRFNYQSQFLGVVYTDLDHNGFYSMGEGRSGITVKATRLAQQISTTTMAAGGYGVVGTAGLNTITFSGSGLEGNISVAVQLADKNVKIDLVDGTTLQTSVSATLGTNAYNLRLLGDFSINGSGNTLVNRLTGNSGNNRLLGYAGNDILSSGSGNDILDGGAGNDVLNGGLGIDYVYYNTATSAVRVNLNITTAQTTGGAGNDTLSGIEHVLGSNFNDTLIGNAGNNALYGGNGNDIFLGGAGNDVLNGGLGGDFAYYNTASSAVFVNLNTTQSTGGAGNDTLIGIEYVLGSNFNDTLIGNAGNNALYGGSGIDGINGSAGNDVLFGGAGNDSLVGGVGSDAFVFDTALNTATNKDSIFDFNAAADTIRLDQTIFAKLTTLGALNPLFFKASTTGLAADANDYLLYNTSSGVLSYDLNGSTLGGAVQFATLTTKPVITATDFFVIA